MKTKIAGLDLWEARIRYRDGRNFIFATLLITTNRQSIGLATMKTSSFLQKHSDGYRDAEILALAHKGTIDA